MTETAATIALEIRTVNTTCAYCGVGCGVTAQVASGPARPTEVLGVSGDKRHPANAGKLCVKGTALHETLGKHGRLLQPEINGQQVSWEQALDEVAARLSRIRAEHGPGAIAFYLSGQLLTEDYYVANKLAKGFVGTPHVDTNSRLCMSSAVVGYKRAFGADAVPCNYDDIDHCQLLVLIGSNAAWTHPVLYQRMAAAKAANPKLKVVVIDPRRTASCDLADLHLAIAPGTDHLIFTGLLAYLHQHRARYRHGYNADYIARATEGFDAALAAAAQRTSAEICRLSGIAEADLLTFYDWFAATEKTLSFYSQGVNQSATGSDNANAIINCHLATGRIGKPGMGPFSITGQPNAMGGREVGGLANMLAAHMDYTPDAIETVGQFWGSDALPTAPGKKAVDLFDAVERGEIKAVWIMATNPVVSMPDANRVRAALENCDTVIVSDCVRHTDTTACADILLPATGWGEKDGTVTNSERMISRQRALLPAPGDARHDWWIVTEVAKRLGFGEAFHYQTPRDIFIEHAALSGYKNRRTRAFDISGLQQLTEQQYAALTPLQWPYPADPAKRVALFSDDYFYTASGKAQFVAVAPKFDAKKSSALPYTLNTGRLRDQWHTMTRTGRAARLHHHSAEPFVALNPHTAAEHQIEEGDLVSVSSQSGAVTLKAQLDRGIAQDSLFVPIHWNNQFSSNARVDALVAPVTDPHSGQPAFKHGGASIAKIAVVQHAVVISRVPLAIADFVYWCKLGEADSDVYCYALATESTIGWQQFLSTQIANTQIANTQIAKTQTAATELSAHQRSDGSTCVSYIDSDNGVEHYLSYSPAGSRNRVIAALYASDKCTKLPHLSWLLDTLRHEFSGSPWQFMTASGSDITSRKICSCFNVSEQRISAAIAEGANSAHALGQKLRCGTKCGSCIPELNSLISDHHRDASSQPLAAVAAISRSAP